MGQASPAPVIPSIDENGQYKDGSSVNQASYQYSIQGEEADTNIINVSGAGADRVTALRPGDIEFTIGNGDVYEGLVDLDGDGTAHIQSFSVSVPMSRTVLQRLGTTFGYARVLDLPINATVSVSAIVSEYGKKVLANALCHSKEYSFTLKLRDCDPTTGRPVTTGAGYKLQIEVKGARLESETFSNTLGDNQTVDISFSCQIGGGNDNSNGLFLYGTYPLFRNIKYFPFGTDKNTVLAPA